jgi:hypothetical protein
MSATDHGPAGSPLTREQVLDELDFLAKVEHALVVECLSVCYALGSAMRVLDDINRLLAQRGLLPPFTPPNAMP